MISSLFIVLLAVSFVSGGSSTVKFFAADPGPSGYSLNVYRIWSIDSSGKLYSCNKTYFSSSTNFTWTSWAPFDLPSNVNSIIQVASHIDNTGYLNIFALDKAGKLWYRHQTNTKTDTWSSWKSLPLPPGATSVEQIATGLPEKAHYSKLEFWVIDNLGKLWTMKMTGSPSWGLFTMPP